MLPPLGGLGLLCGGGAPRPGARRVARTRTSRPSAFQSLHNGWARRSGGSACDHYGGADCRADPGGTPLYESVFSVNHRRVTRDFLDFAALSDQMLEREVVDSLLKLDMRYGELQTALVGLEVAKALSAAAPFDLNEAELPAYKGLAPKWHNWEATRGICHRFGVALGESLLK